MAMKKVKGLTVLVFALALVLAPAADLSAQWQDPDCFYIPYNPPIWIPVSSDPDCYGQVLGAWVCPGEEIRFIWSGLFRCSFP